MEGHTEFFSGAAINGTISTDIGTLSPAVVSTLTCPTDVGWGDEYSATMGAMAMFSVLTGVNFSLAAVSSVINDRCEPSSKRIFPCIRTPLPTTGAIAVFSKVTVSRISLLLCTPCRTGAVWAPTCCVASCVDCCTCVSVPCVLDLGVSLSWDWYGACVCSVCTETLSCTV